MPILRPKKFRHGAVPLREVCRQHNIRRELESPPYSLFYAVENELDNCRGLRLKEDCYISIFVLKKYSGRKEGQFRPRAVTISCINDALDDGGYNNEEMETRKHTRTVVSSGTVPNYVPHVISCTQRQKRAIGAVIIHKEKKCHFLCVKK
jgi:hypothetical protein